ERRPRRERRARRLHCFVDISGATVSDVSERLAGRRIVRREGLASLGPFAVDEVAEGVALARKPRQRRLRTLGRWTVVEALEDFSNLVHVTPSACGSRPRNGRSGCARAGVRYR